VDIQGGNQWHWAKLLEASSDHRPGADPTSFAYMRDRIAIAFPRVGVKVWLWVKGLFVSLLYTARLMTVIQACGSRKGLF